MDKLMAHTYRKKKMPAALAGNGGMAPLAMI
jgi:hypothetical protein